MASFRKKLRKFREQFRTFRREAGSIGCSWLSQIRHFSAWSRSLAPGASPLADERPWMTFPAIELLDRHLRTGARVFEWGGGGSTLFFARRASEIITIENDADWARDLRAKLAAEGLKHCTVELIEPEPEPVPPPYDPADPAQCVSASKVYGGRSFRAYAERIDSFPDAHFDIIVVDGRARPSCLIHAMPKVKIGGLLVLDDAERDYYQRAQAELRAPHWRLHDGRGPSPYLWYFKKTHAWQRLS